MNFEIEGNSFTVNLDNGTLDRRARTFGVDQTFENPSIQFIGGALYVMIEGYRFLYSIDITILFGDDPNNRVELNLYRKGWIPGPTLNRPTLKVARRLLRKEWLVDEHSFGDVPVVGREILDDFLDEVESYINNVSPSDI